jgi:simple sugar transport system substrate-binding protein
MLFSNNSLNITATPSVGLENVKAGFIYVGPVGDYGWTNAHDAGRQIVNDSYDWLDTVYVETIAEDPASVVAAVDTMIAQEGVDVIFTTSFGFMDGTIDAATKYPDKIFFHASGFKRAANVGTYFADFYQLYYLNGLMAGALTESNKLGYVAAFPIPEVIRHINAWALGAKEANPDATVDVVWLNSWYNPTAAKNAAESLVAKGVDMLAFTEDSPAVMEVAKANDGVSAFSHYSPMQSYAPQSTVSGQLVHWEILYDEILTGIHDGTYTKDNLNNVDFLYFLKEGAVELGGDFGDPINTPFVQPLKDATIGSDSAYDLIMSRIDAMNKTYADAFDPFTGPIKAQNGTEMFASGVRASIPDLFSDMTWFVDNVVGTIPGQETTASTPPDLLAIPLAFFVAGAFQVIRKKKIKK